jgi:hypothetical protein
VHGFPAYSLGRLLLIFLLGVGLHADPVPVRHGFVVLKTLAGTRIAIGDMTQIVHGDRVTSRHVFHFSTAQSTATPRSSPSVALFASLLITISNAALPFPKPAMSSSTR